MTNQVQTQPVVAQEVILNGLDQLSRKIQDVIRVDPKGTVPADALREIDRQVSALYCAIRFGQMGGQTGQ